MPPLFLIQVKHGPVPLQYPKVSHFPTVHWATLPPTSATAQPSHDALGNPGCLKQSKTFSCCARHWLHRVGKGRNATPQMQQDWPILWYMGLPCLPQCISLSSHAKVSSPSMLCPQYDTECTWSQALPPYLAQRVQEPWAPRSRFIERSDTLRELWNCRPSSSRIGFTGPSPSSSLLSEATDTADRSTLRCENKRCSEVTSQREYRRPPISERSLYPSPFFWKDLH